MKPSTLIAALAVLLSAVAVASAADTIDTMVPAEDPAVRGASPEIVPALKDRHPRLLFSAEDIAALREFAKTPRGKFFMDRLNGYLGASVKPTETKFLTDATDGQRQGMWRLPTVALHYVLTGDKKSFDRTVDFMKFLMDQPHWETTDELDSGMSAANVMIGAALAYDWLYNDLDPAFREQYRRKLWEQARRMYYSGHLMRAASKNKYWQNDPQNNHRWHRDAGFALCALAAANGDPSEKWLLQKLRDELQFVVDWLPEDGTSHESFGYTIFGAAHLTLAVQAGDRCFGTQLLNRPFFANLPKFMTQSLTPGITNRFSFGDQTAPSAPLGDVGYNVFELKLEGDHNLPDYLAATCEQLDRYNVSDVSAWLGLIWYPRDLKPGSIDSIPTRAFFPDLGMLIVRQSWKAGDAAAMFKCGPFGGYLLNLYKREYPLAYLNVAHDDPDANSFILFTRGAFVAQTNGYSEHKQSAHHNTILVNGSGQMAFGRGEDGVWSAPSTRGDMSDIAVITAMATQGDNLAIEGEAAGSYPPDPPGRKPRPALDRYRRAFIWVQGKYVLVLDDIRAPRAVDVDWLMQAPAVLTIDPDANKYRLAAGDVTCPFQVATSLTMAGAVVDSTADEHGKPLGWKQLRLSATTDKVRLASVYDLWNKGDITVALKADGDDHAVVTVTGDDFADTWDWTAGEGRFGASKVVGKATAGQDIITMDQPEPETRKLLDRNIRFGTAAQMTLVKVTASAWEEKAKGGFADFLPQYAVDGDTADASSWRAEGDGQWIEFDLGAEKPLAGIDVAFTGGDKRSYSFSVEVSPNAQVWNEVFKGASDGKTAGFQAFDLADAKAKARYVRIIGHGNTNEKFKDWININEVRIRLADE